MESKEVWKDIPGYENMYQASTLGRIRSVTRWVRASNKYLKQGVIRKLKKDTKGYFQVGLSKNGIEKKKKVHRLIAMTFIPNPNSYPQVNHKDEDKENNRVENLEWCDNYYNCHYGTVIERRKNSQGKEIEKYDLNGNFIEKYSSITEAEKKNGVVIPMSDIRKGIQKTAGGYIWKCEDNRYSKNHTQRRKRKSS